MIACLAYLFEGGGDPFVPRGGAGRLCAGRGGLLRDQVATAERLHALRAHGTSGSSGAACARAALRDGVAARALRRVWILLLVWLWLWL